MKRLSFRLLIALLTFLIGVTVTIVWWTYGTSLSPYEIGKAEAARDLQNGKLILQQCGGARAYQSEEILRRSYNIETRWAGDCFKAHGYNSISIEAINSRYGGGVLERFNQQASEEVLKTH